jgi:hypothetical protein
VCDRVCGGHTCDGDGGIKSWRRQHNGTGLNTGAGNGLVDGGCDAWDISDACVIANGLSKLWLDIEAMCLIAQISIFALVVIAISATEFGMVTVLPVKVSKSSAYRWTERVEHHTSQGSWLVHCLHVASDRAMVRDDNESADDSAAISLS